MFRDHDRLVVISDGEHSTLRISVVRKGDDFEGRSITQWSVMRVTDGGMPEGDWGDDLRSGVGMHPTLDERMATLASFLRAHAETVDYPESENAGLFSFSPHLSDDAADLLEGLIVKDKGLACGHSLGAWIESPDDLTQPTVCPECGLIVSVA